MSVRPFIPWEYRIESLEYWNEEEAQDLFNRLGGLGWELVIVSQSLRTFIFKRQGEQNGDQNGL